MPTDEKDPVVFELQQSQRSYWKRVLRMWNVYNLWLILGMAINLIIHGLSATSNFLVFLFLSVLALIYSCVKQRKILLQLAYYDKTAAVEVSLLQYNTSKQILLAPQKDVKIQVRKHYRYRYPVDCLVILFKNKQFYAQEEVHPGWPRECFVEIEQYFKNQNKDTV